MLELLIFGILVFVGLFVVLPALLPILLPLLLIVLIVRLVSSPREHEYVNRMDDRSWRDFRQDLRRLRRRVGNLESDRYDWKRRRTI